MTRGRRPRGSLPRTLIRVGSSCWKKATACATRRLPIARRSGATVPVGLGATSLATVMQMVANGYGVTLVPQVAVDVEVRDERVKLLRFAPPAPGRLVGLAWRQTSPRKTDFLALGQIIMQELGFAAKAKAYRSA